jgi:hypothetical protein
MMTVLVDPPPGADVDGADYIVENVVDVARVVIELGEDGDATC